MRKLRTGVLAYLFIPAASFGRAVKPFIYSDSTQQHHKTPHKKEAVKVQYGVASYYANKFEGRKTCTDEIFRQEKFTGASNTLPMHTWVRVTNLRNHRAVIVQINDKMHPRNKRLIDLTRAAAKKLGYAGRGLTKVRVDVLGRKRPADADVPEEGALTKEK